MEQFNHKEKIFKNILDDIQFDIDTNEIWDQIENRIPNKKRNRKLLWLWSIGLVCSFSAILWFISNNNISTQKIPNNSISLKSTIDDTRLKKTNIPSIYSVQNNQSRKEQTDNKNEQTEDKYNISSKIELDYESSIQNSNIPLNNNSKNKKYNTITDSNNPINSLNLDTNLSYNETNLYHQHSIAYIPTQSLNREYNKYSNPLLKIPQLPLNIIELCELNKNDITIHKAMDIVIIPSLKIKKWQPYFTIYSGLNQNNSNYKLSKNDTENNREGFNFETGMVGISTDLIFGRTNHNQYYWYTGIGHHFIVSKYQNQTQEIIESFTDGIIESYIDKNNNIKETTGQVRKTTIKRNDITWYRKHQMLDAKLGIGKQLIKIGNLSLKIETGAALTLISDNNGYYFDKNNNKLIKIKDGDKHPYINFGNLKFNGRISIEYSLDRFAFGLSSFYSKDLNSSTLNSNHYELKNNQYGLQFSLLFRP